MSDEPFFPGRPRLMTPEAARDIARGYKGLAMTFTEADMHRDAARAMQDSQWWLTYALALSQTKGEAP
jgi:hypothetical protein